MLGDNKIFTQYHASTLEIMSKMRDNFFNPGVLMQICDKTYAGKVASLYFCLDYQIEQNNLLRENIKKTDYLNTKTSYEKREKLTPKKSLMWPRNSGEGGDDKQAQCISTCI